MGVYMYVFMFMDMFMYLDMFMYMDMFMYLILKLSIKDKRQKIIKNNKR